MNTWDALNAGNIRHALTESVNGRSGAYVYARASSNGREFRIVAFKHHRGLAYGRELSTGKWVVICEWQER